MTSHILIEKHTFLQLRIRVVTGLLICISKEFESLVTTTRFVRMMLQGELVIGSFLLRTLGGPPLYVQVLVQIFPEHTDV